MNFMRLRNWYFALSLLFVVPSIMSLLLYGLRPSIDFTGGSAIEIELEEPMTLEYATVAPLIADQFELQSLQSSGENSYVLKGGEISNEQKDQVVAVLSNQYGNLSVGRFERVGATVSSELLIKTLTAVLLVAGVITIYVWYQFQELRFGVSAILAMLHDSVILLGLFSILGHFYGVQVDILFVTALLTTLSFSIHDTIVVFDRIRELSRKYRGRDFVEVVNQAVTETLARSINNSVTIVVMLASLFLLGGETIRYFSLALLVGAIVGTYSSTFTAAPLLLLWQEVEAWRKKMRQRDRKKGK